jgi:hypothetical protein
LISVIIFIIVLGSSSINERLCASSPSVENSTEEGNEQPDEECLYEPSLLKCTPGPEGCPMGFSMNAYEQCFPRHQGGCPKGYHSHEDDESGRCIPDSEECAKGYIMNPVYPECQRIEYVCEKHPTIKECLTEVTNIQNITSRTPKCK